MGCRSFFIFFNSQSVSMFHFRDGLIDVNDLNEDFALHSFPCIPSISAAVVFLLVVLFPFFGIGFATVWSCDSCFYYVFFLILLARVLALGLSDLETWNFGLCGEAWV